MNRSKISNDIISRLRSTRRKEFLNELTADGFTFAGVLFIIVFTISVIEYIGNGDEIFRGSLFYSGIGLCIAFALLIFKEHLKRLVNPSIIDNDYKMAMRVGKYFPDIKDNLSNALQILDNKDNGLYSSEIGLAAYLEISSTAVDKDFDVIINKKRIRRSLLLFMPAILLVFSMFTFLGSSLGASLNRVVNYNDSYLPPVPFKLSIEPIKSTAIRGSSAIIRIKSSKNNDILYSPPEEIVLVLKELGQSGTDKIILKKDTSDTYSYKISSIKNSTQFSAYAEWFGSKVDSPIGFIEVLDLPVVKSISGSINYPAYTKLPTKQFDDRNAEITALKGSLVKIDILSNKELSRAEIRFIPDINSASKDTNLINKSDTLDYFMKVEGSIAQGSFRVTTNGKYYIRIYDKNDVYNIDPIKYSIVSLTDEYPSINLIEPDFDISLTEDALLPIRVAIIDDYGFSSLKLKYRLVSSSFGEPYKSFKEIKVPMISNDNPAEVPFLWNLNKIGISPEDKFEIYLEVADNDIITGPKTAKTQIITVSLPSLDEVLKESNQIHTSIEQEFKKALKKSEEIQKDIQELKKDLLKSTKERELNWDQRKKTEDIANKQTQLNSKISELKDKLQDLSNKLEQNNLMSQETVEKFKQLQKMLKEMDTPEIRAMQRRFEEQMKNINPQELQKAMEKMEFDEEKFKQGIERTMNMLKRLQAEQNVDALKKMAEKLAEKQDELENQVAKSNPNDQQKREELAKKQDAISENMKDLTEQIEQTKKLLEDIQEKNAQEDLEKGERDLNPKDTKDQMNKAEENIGKQDYSQAQKNQSKASQNLKKFANQMSQMKQNMQMNNIQDAIRNMQKAANDMLEVSQTQENLRDDTKNLDYNSNQFEENARDQMALYEKMKNIANNMAALSQRSMAVTPQMAQEMAMAMKSMQGALDKMSDRESGGASQMQSQAMGGMNKAISQMQKQLSNLKDQASACQNPGQGSSGSGQSQGSGSQGDGMSGEQLMQKLQDLAQNQMGINQAMQQLTGGPQGDRLTPAKQNQMGKISKEQGNAAKALEELSKESKNMEGGKLNSDNLEKLVKEMQEVVSDMQSGNLSERTMKKQERILSRLLDATRSVNERDMDKKRESKSGNKYSNISPSELTPELLGLDKNIMEELIKNMQEGYSKDFEALIRQYFNKLGENKKN